MKNLLLLVTLSACACSSSKELVCEPGRSMDCTCPNLAQGSQICRPDGSAWADCVCECVPSCANRECGSDGCDGTCPPGCGANQTCSAEGHCECQVSYQDCDANAQNGCEADLSSDADHCGDCSEACVYDHATALCVNQVCQLGPCDAGYHLEVDRCVKDGRKIRLTWTFEGTHLTCTQAQVANVQVELYQADTALSTQTLPCETGGATIEGVADGDYSVGVTAFSNSQQSTYSRQQDVTVSGQDVDLGVVVLEPVGFMVFSTTFGASELDCATARVGAVRVTVNSEDGAQNIYTTAPPLACIGAWLQPDAIFPLGTYSLVLEGLCQSAPARTGYRADLVMDLTEKGENNYGSINLPENPASPGGCP